jgi:CotH kinase protein/Chitobiase/beta-hexosaminidase C-terminal domain/Lamin Tail Domain
MRAAGTMAGSFMAVATPGDDNAVGVQGFVADTKFSVDRGIFDAAFQLAITSDTPDAQIRYTTDGSVPTPASGTLYSGPIDIGTTTILRAVAFKESFSSSNVDTMTYIFVDDVLDQSAADVTLPYAPWGHDKDDAGSESGYNLDDEADWDLDPDIVDGNEQAVKDALVSIPSMSLVLDWDDLFGGAPMPGTFAVGTNAAPQPHGIYIHGTSSERLASLEYVNPNAATDTFQVDVGVEMQGHSSTLRWNSDKMSFQVKFKFPYGPTELNYPLFADALFGEGATSEFDTLILDAMFNYTWHHANPIQRNYARFVTDQVVSDLQNLASGEGAAHGKYVHLYLNGMYWGLYNVHERPDDSYASKYYGGDKDDYDVIKHSTNENLSQGGHNYTWVEGGVAAEERYAALLSATEAVRDNPASAAAYQAVEQLLDVDQFLDYMIVHMYSGNANDWPHNNWYATSDRTGGLWRFHAWDQEHAIPTDDNGDNFDQFVNLSGYDAEDDFESPADVFHDLIGSAEFRLRFNDRVQALMHNDGVLTSEYAAAVYQARIDEITEAIFGESARWGDNRASNDPYTQADFLAVNNAVVNDFFPQRTNAVIGHFQSAGWLGSLAAPVLNNYGGEVLSGFDVTIGKPVGAPVDAEIYYTLDGSDPRLPGGAANPAAVHGVGPFSVEVDMAKQIKVRIKNGSDWSPLIDATFSLPEASSLRIVELMYNPPGSGDATEYLELLNTGEQPLDLAGVQITDFSSGGYTFTGGTLAAGERIVVVNDQVEFAAAYPGVANVAPGVFSGSLANEGELISLRGPLGDLVQSFAYGDGNIAGWPADADGDGRSLEYIGPFDQDVENPATIVGDPYDSSANWRASLRDGGSPGSDGQPTVDPIPGDYDANGTVEILDYNKWKADFGMIVAPGEGADGNGNGVVDAGDYTVWRDNRGSMLANQWIAESAAATTAPIGMDSEIHSIASNDGLGARMRTPPELPESPILQESAGTFFTELLSNRRGVRQSLKLAGALVPMGHDLGDLKWLLHSSVNDAGVPWSIPRTDDIDAAAIDSAFESFADESHGLQDRIQVRKNVPTLRHWMGRP